MEDNRKDSDILNKMKRLSEGPVIIPLVLTIVVITSFPQVLQIGGYVIVSFYDGSSAMMGLFLIACGSIINTRQVGIPLYRSITLTGIKLPLGVVVDLLVGKLCGPVDILGLIPFVLIAAITSSNGSLYISLSSQPGNVTDMGATSILPLNNGPLFTLVALGATGLASIPLKALVAALIPLFIGFIWGSMDKGFYSAYATAQSIVAFLMTISIGSETDASTLVMVGTSGITLGLISTTTAAVFFFVLNLLLSKKEHNAMGAAVGTTTLNSAATPAAVTQANLFMKPHVDMTAAQCATAPIIMLFLCPFIIVFFDDWMRKNKRGIYSPEGQVAGKARLKRGMI